jgi:hypothetical protein
MTGNDARAACQGIGADLVMIKTESFNREVDELNRTNGFNLHDNLWIGLFKKDINNNSKDPSNWVWADGTDASYTNWASGEPNNFAGNEDCVYMGHDWTSKMDEWDDFLCHQEWASVLCAVLANPLGKYSIFRRQFIQKFFIFN